MRAVTVPGSVTVNFLKFTVTAQWHRVTTVRSVTVTAARHASGHMIMMPVIQNVCPRSISFFESKVYIHDIPSR
jgi:hypothetical protein